MTTSVVCGASGMIGWALVERLLAEGHEVRAVDIEPTDRWQKVNANAENIGCLDLRVPDFCEVAVAGVDYCWDLAFAMGGIQFIERQPFDCIESMSIASHLLRASINAGVDRFWYASSACAYAARFQTDPDVTALDESMAWPAEPERGYGTGKLADEEQCWAAREQYGLETRVGRYHNIFSGGPTTWTGGKEKAPAAVCRKIATAVLTGNPEIEVWGDGSATRSYCWIDDCVEGTLRLMASDYPDPVNIGSAELISVDDLYHLVAKIAGLTDYELVHDLSAPRGVAGRNSCNRLCREVLGWEPSTQLADGMAKLYEWVYDRVREAT